MRSQTALLMVPFALMAFQSFGQKRIVVLGSSTAYGIGASSPELSWVGRLQASFRINTMDGVDTAIDNRAYPGYVTYQSMPTGYALPANRTSYTPDPQRNITYVLNSIPRPNIVIINYPSNDVRLPDYNPKETMDNFRLMYQQLTSNGITCYISTTQPRNDFTDAERLILKKLVDSVQNNFGYYAINFWDDLVTTDGLNRLKPEVNSGDDIHTNDLGHQLLFQRVQAKDIFSAILPVVLEEWKASLENHSVLVRWTVANEESGTSYEVQRSENGRNFQTVFKEEATLSYNHYLWTDASPLQGRSFYRLKINEPGAISYSPGISILNEDKKLIIGWYANASSLHIQISPTGSSSAELSVIDFSGILIQKQTIKLSGVHDDISLPISGLASGAYLLKVTTNDDFTGVERFIKMK